MPNPWAAPEITVQDLVEKQKAGHDFVLMDVREPNELLLANLGDQVTVVPLSLLAAQQTAALPDNMLDKATDIVVMCHHGVRSAQVTAWLLQQGWTNVVSLAGGIDAYAKEIDSSVGSY